MRYFPQKVEKRQQKKWNHKKIYEPDFSRAKKPFYNLMMFPYPSAEGLHVGNMYAFTGSDVYGRFKRMQGYDVFEPIGLDGFGIHSENYAMKIGAHPMRLAQKTQKNFYRQLEMMGNSFSWDEKLETYDSQYYRWTQWIFIQMFKQGLAYRKKAEVNWCPGCKTVLADEQVIAGLCERCGSTVIKKDLEQWFFKITKYAGKLLTNLDKIDWSEKVKIAQKNWIGKSEGAEINFKLNKKEGLLENFLKIFTTRPDTIFGATFLAISPELAAKWMNRGWKADETAKKYIKNNIGKSEADRINEKREKTGVDSGIKAINPATNQEISIWITDYVLGNVGTGAIMAVPAHDERDFQFAQKYSLPILMVICPNYPEKTCPILDYAYEGEGYLVASGKFDGMKSEKAREEITKFLGGEKKITYRLRDWLISRQRYWGAPIPMIYCPKCAAENKGEKKEMPGWYSESEKNLPVKLPFIKDFRPTGKNESPLASVAPFFKVKCPKCRSEAKRETDVSDTFLDSAWYYLRYLSPQNKKNAWNKNLVKKWLPVDMYIGGAEHAVLHLLYIRFLAHAFSDFGLIPFKEPIKKFRAHGLLIKDGAKMSKSKGNVINPDDYVRAYGADAMRMYLMFLAPFEQGGDFRDKGMKGITRFLERVWKLGAAVQEDIIKKNSVEVKRALHRTIKKVTEDIENLQYNTSISTLMILLNLFEKKRESVSKDEFNTFLKLLAPFAPHITDELWGALDDSAGFPSIHVSPWPNFSPKLIKENEVLFVVQVNGKFRGTLLASVSAAENDIVNMARKNERIGKNIKETPKKIIFVKGKLINFVM